MKTNFWQKGIETADRKEISRLQECKLQEMLKYVEDRSGFYRDKFKMHGVSCASLTSLSDLKKLPFTDRREILENQAERSPFGTLMCTDRKDPGQVIGQTGDRFSTTGERLRAIVSVTDLANQGKLAARGLISAGITNKDYLYVADFPQFNLIYMHTGLGSINVGSKSLLVGMERAERNIRIYMELYPPSAFFISPSYAKFMGNMVHQTGKKFPVKTIMGWNEPGYSLPSVRKNIEELWRGVSLEGEVNVYDACGMIEVGYLGFECQEQSGMHGFEDSYIYEVVHPETGAPLSPGQEGELVITHLDREAMPLIRYRTGDITMLDDTPCPCGRTHVRFKGIKGRWAERLEVNGVTIYYSQVDDAMAQIRQYEGSYNIFINGSQKFDVLEIAVDQEKLGKYFKNSMREALEKQLGVPVEVKPVPAPDLLVYPHRSRRIIDRTHVEAYRKELKVQLTAET